MSRWFLRGPKPFFQWYDKTYLAYPLTTSGLTLGIKAGGCDILAQKYTNPDCELDYPRIAKFTAFCVVYVGSFQHVLFNVVYPKLFVGDGMRVAASKALFDNFVHSPLLYLPTYYGFKSVAEGGTIMEGLQEYVQEGWEVLKACWVLWVPAQFINFWLIPRSFRIAYVAFMGSVWEIVLSYLAPMKSSNQITVGETSETDKSSRGGGSVLVRDHIAGNFDACPLSPVSVHPHSDQASRHLLAEKKKEKKMLGTESSSSDVSSVSFKK